MKILFLTHKLVLFALCLASLSCAADQLIYTPVNPTFGGNPNNAPGLLAIANAQNDFKAPVPEVVVLTPLQKFNQSLLNSVLSRLNTKLLGELFSGDNGSLAVGSTIQSGNYEIKVSLADQTTCGCPVGSLLLTTRDVTIPGSGTSIVVGAN